MIYNGTADFAFSIYDVEAYYKTDYEIYNWCVKRREELVKLRAAELGEKAAAAQ